MSLRAFAYGDLAGGSWGAAWIPAEPEHAVLLGSAAGPGGARPQLTGERADEPWHLTAGATELTLEGLGEPGCGETSDQGFDQLCQVTGAQGSESGPTTIASLGWRSARSEPLVAGSLDSVRQVAAWFAQDDGLALLSARPEGGRGQERDQITAALFTPAGAKQVVDPRLSTTYNGAEQPTRASVELWVETEGESETQYPRRAIGEALAEAGQARAGALILEACPFRWYSGGLEGAGIYLIGRAA